MSTFQPEFPFWPFRSALVIHQTPFRLESYSEQVVQPAVDIIVNMIDSDGLALVNDARRGVNPSMSPKGVEHEVWSPGGAELILGDSLSEFMRKVGIYSTSGDKHTRRAVSDCA